MNLNCQIPFTSGGIDRYFCVQSASKWVCDTGGGVNDECDRGTFLDIINHFILFELNARFLKVILQDFDRFQVEHFTKAI